MSGLDNEFDKVFRKGIDQPDFSKPSEKEWENLSNRLDLTKKSKFGWIWFLIPFLLALFGWTSFKIIDLQRQVLSISTLKKLENKVLYDTVYRTYVHFDTIYKTIYVNKNVKYNHSYTSYLNSQNQSSINNIHNSESTNIFGQSSESTTKTTMTNSNILKQGITANSDIDSSLLSPEDKPLSKSKAETFNSSQNGNNSESDLGYTFKNNEIETPKNNEVHQPMDNKPNTNEKSINYNELTLSIETDQKAKKTFLEKLGENFKTEVLENERVSFRIGTGFGSGTTLGLGNQDISHSVLLALHGEILFGSKWTIVPAINYSSYNSKIENEFSVRSLLPLPISPGDNYRYKYVEGNYKYWIPSLSLRYRVRSNAVWSGYIGVGIAANIFKETKWEYEYLENATDIEYKYYINHKIPSKYSILKFQIGSTFNLTDRIALFGDLDTYIDIGANTKLLPYVSTCLGAKYLIF